MKTIILIQTLIIIIGGYYIYNITQSAKSQVNINVATTTATNTAQNIHPGYIPPTENPPSLNSSTTINSKNVPGHSDAGMEYPIPDVEGSTTLKKSISQ